MPSAPLAKIEIAIPSDFAAVKNLIIQGLAARWGQYEAQFNPDLADFAASYGGALVVVAKAEKRLIGCGLLLNDSTTTARIVRMTVEQSMQRRGIGSQILIALLNAAKAGGFSEVCLETTASWQSALSFYLAHGFEPCKMEHGDQHFRMAIKALRDNPKPVGTF